MTVPYYSCPVTRRLFIERSFQGTAAVVLSGFAVFTPPKALAAEQPSLSIDLPSPQFAAWAPDRKLLITFIAPDGSYGVMQKGRDPKDSDTFLSVGTATGQFNWPQGIAVSG